VVNKYIVFLPHPNPLLVKERERFPLLDKYFVQQATPCLIYFLPHPNPLLVKEREHFPLLDKFAGQPSRGV
jgi:hypothetical protein